MIHIKRSKGRKLLRATPDLTRLKKALGHSLTIFLLMVGLVGVTYSLAPLLFQPETTAVEKQPAASEVPVVKPIGLARSVPTKLDIPDISLSTELITTGKNPDGTLAVPERYDIAAWYEYSPTPGEVGPSIIVGHVDTYLGPAVFFSLQYLQPGQLIHITRQDGSVVTFKVDRLALFDQDNFPTAEVYGNIDYQGLRLITCGGVFNHLTGYYMQNTVVYASYVPS